MKFPYRSYQINPAPGFPEGIVWRPRIPLLVIGLTGELWLEALVEEQIPPEGWNLGTPRSRHSR